MDPVERIAAALERIADALERFEVDGSAPEVCDHEKREDFSAMGIERWRCRTCGVSVGMDEVKL